MKMLVAKLTTIFIGTLLLVHLVCAPQQKGADLPELIRTAIRSNPDTLEKIQMPASVAENAGSLSATDLAKIRAVNEAYRDGWLRNDPVLVLGTLSRDAVLIPGADRAIEGIEAIKKFWWPADGSRTTITSFAITTDEIGGDGGVAYVRGTFHFTFSYEAKGERKDHVNVGNYLMILKRQPDGNWRISRRMWAALPQ